MATVGRFGTSALSRSKKEFSRNEEIMMNKETGQVLIKTPDGTDIISYDSIARLRSHINSVTLLAQTNGLRGDIHSIEFDDIELPEKIQEDTNLLASPLTVKTGNLKRFLFSVDVDAIELSMSDTIGKYEPIVTIDLQFSLGEALLPLSITGTSSQVNTRVVNAASYFEPGTDLTGHTLTITGIRVTKNSSYTAESLRHILHSALIVVE